MEEEAPHAAALYEELIAQPDAMRTLVEEWESRRPRLGFTEYSFFYDVNIPHERQSGFHVVNENVAQAVMALDEGQIAPPVRSRNAWHILRLEEHHPEQHRTLEDEEVRREIMESVLHRRLEAEFLMLVEGLRAVYDVRVYPEVLGAFFLELEDVLEE